MQPNDPLAQLRDLHYPPAIQAWPPAFGWWLLLLLIIAAITLSLIAWLRYRRRNAYKREALRQLEQLQASHDSNTYLQALNPLLKRTAQHSAGAEAASKLSGKAWLLFLDGDAGGRDFSEGIGQVLASGPYQETPSPFDTQALTKLAAQWIKRQRPRC